jgi:hypothetical protein
VSVNKADSVTMPIQVDFPGVPATLSAEALVLCSQRPLQMLLPFACRIRYGGETRDPQSIDGVLV